jgi:ABC-2 type transport system permease protein
MLNNLKHIWYIALNDARLFLTDRLAVGMFILFPFLFIVMFNMLLGNVGAEDTRMQLHVATRETAGISLHLIQSMETTDEASLPPGAPVIIWEKDFEKARAAVEDNSLAGFLAFPADFTQKVESGQPASLEIIARSDATNMRMALNGLAQGIASGIKASTVEIKAVTQLLMQQGASQAEIQKAVLQILQREGSETGSGPLITYQVNNVGEVKPVNASSFVVPGYLVMFVFFAAAMASASIIRERRNHTLERLLASSVKKESILGGYFLGGILRGLIQIAIFWTLGILVFHVDIGAAPWAVIVLSLLMVLMSAAFSVMLATLVKTERAASSLAVLCSLLLAPLGGCWWPLFIDPPWMQFLAKLTPHGWANEGFNKLMLFGANGSDTWLQMVALMGFALAFLAVAVINFRATAEAT